MKTSDKPTAHILVRASTNSEWDCCDFAIIHLSEEWRKLQEKRLEAVKPFANDYSFQSMRFYDGSVDFFQSGDEKSLTWKNCWQTNSGCLWNWMMVSWTNLPHPKAVWIVTYLYYIVMEMPDTKHSANIQARNLGQTFFCCNS